MPCLYLVWFQHLHIIMLYYDGKGKYQQECGVLWRTLVPKSGQADTVQGELVRVIVKLEDECLRNGNCNWDRGHRMFTNFLYRHLRDAAVFDALTISRIEADIAEIRDYGSGKKQPTFKEDEEDAFDRITDKIVEWCRQNPTPIPHKKNPKLGR
jgi:hypothetical protein